jgi:hypothetical protein
MKHIIWVTASRPDESKRPLYNTSEKFDEFGWTQCEEWIKKVSNLIGDPRQQLIYSESVQ